MRAVLPGNGGNCKASLRHLGKSASMVNSDNTNAKLMEVVRKAGEKSIFKLIVSPTVIRKRHHYGTSVVFC